MKNKNIFNIVEVWDKDSRKNESSYLTEEYRYVALSKYFNETEFVKFFVKTSDKKFNFLIKLWAYLNK